MDAFTELLQRPMMSPTAKLVALHLARKLAPDAVDVPSHPRDEAKALGVSRGDYERGWRECCRAKWLVGPSPTRLTMPPDVLPRRAVAQVDPFFVEAAPVAPPSKPRKAGRPPKTESDE